MLAFKHTLNGMYFGTACRLCCDRSRRLNLVNSVSISLHLFFSAPCAQQRDPGKPARGVAWCLQVGFAQSAFTATAPSGRGRRLREDGRPLLSRSLASPQGAETQERGVGPGGESQQEGPPLFGRTPHSLRAAQRRWRDRTLRR